MIKKYTNCNMTKLHDELIAAGIEPFSVTAETGQYDFVDGAVIGTINIEYANETDAVRGDMVAAKHIPGKSQNELIASLDAEYQAEFQELQLAWAAANLDGNTALAAELQTDYAALKAEYNTKREEIIIGN